MVKAGDRRKNVSNFSAIQEETEGCTVLEMKRDLMKLCFQKINFISTMKNGLA